MAYQRHNAAIIGRAVADNIRYWAGGRWRQSRPVPTDGCRVPHDFFGICVASAPEPECDEYVIKRLNELGISCVRLDFTYDSRQTHAERFLKRLLDKSFHVCLHLVQPPAEARDMNNPDAQEQWKTFVAETLDAYGPRLDMVEIGSTCNRRRWTGYTPATFLLSWQIAWKEAHQRGITVAGPNVTDFEPFYNVSILSELKRSGMLPAIHTDNLFVERATEPEAFDHKVLGRRLAGTIRFNLIRKAQLLNDIGRWAGVSATICSHTAWSLRRIARMLGHIEEKQADYVARYGCLAAASGALRRIYWGPLIGQREGLIDDGTSEYPDIPHAAFYGHANGYTADYRPRPAFSAFRTVNRFLSGGLFRQKIPTKPGLEILEFAQLQNAECRMQNAELLEFEGRTTDNNNLKSKILHAVWTTNGNRAAAAACYTPDMLKTATAYSRDGEKLNQVPTLFSESPVYLVFNGEPLAVSSEQQESLNARHDYDRSPLTRRSQPLRDEGGPEVSNRNAECRMQNAESKIINHKSKIPMPGIIAGVRFAAIPGQVFAPIRHADWTGYYLAENAGQAFDMTPLLAMLPYPAAAASELPHAAIILRDSRNRVWSVPAPGEHNLRLVIKQFKPRGFWSRLTQRHQPDRAQRSWNGAQELLRRGIPTPQPIAFIRDSRLPAAHPSFYICRAFENGWSAREAFTAFSRGAAQFQEKSKTDLFETIAHFLRTLHKRGVFFRDLSAGNLLFRCKAKTDIEFALIDTARARFYPGMAGLRHCLCDLIRLCHPLDWPRRKEFVGTYMQFMGRRFSLWMKIPFVYYDAKHWIKNAVKKKCRRQNY